MPKCSIKNRISQVRVLRCVLTVLAAIGVVHLFAYHGAYNYPHVPLAEVRGELYRAAVPSLPPLPAHAPPCTYEHVLNATESTRKEDIPTNYDEFRPTGLANGSYSPPACAPAFSVALLVTYRNRQKQLDVFLPYMHNFLRKQNIHYKIYLIEQRDEKPWNKGLLYNIGAARAIADRFPCLVLHDVDLLPLDAGNLYACANSPRHMSAAIDKFRYVLPYERLVGGVLAVRADHYRLLNGLSNRFTGWGGEDDDLADRMERANLRLLRFPPRSSRYTMMVHTQEPANADRRRIMAENHARDPAVDGYNSVKYTAIEVSNHKLFTMIGVKL